MEVSSLFFLVLFADPVPGGAADVTEESWVRTPVDDPEVVLRKVFRSGLANWSALYGEETKVTLMYKLTTRGCNVSKSLFYSYF